MKLHPTILWIALALAAVFTRNWLEGGMNRVQRHVPIIVAVTGMILIIRWLKLRKHRGAA